ncbi:MAG: thiol reductant ABC exporter subunit CydC [Acidimicrobiales bacterium]
MTVHLRGARRSADTATGLAGRVLRMTPRRLAPAIASGAVTVACGIGLMATSGWLITRASQRPPVFVLSIAIGAVQAFALGRGISRYLQRLSVHDLALEVLGNLRLYLFDQLEPLVPGGLRESSGTVLSGFVSGAEAVAEAVAKDITAKVDVSSSILLGGFVACLIDSRVGIVLVAGAACVVGAAIATARIGRSAAASEARSREEIADLVIETARAARELTAYGREDLVEARLGSVRRRSTAAAVRRALASGSGRAAVTFVSGASVIAVVAFGLAQNHAHRLSGTMLAVVAFVSLAVFEQCGSLPSVLAETVAGDAAARRLRELAGLRAPAPEPSRDLSPGRGPVAARLERAGVILDGTPILQDVSLNLEPGRRIALVGRSGSGKTSALHSLLHFVECTTGRASLGGVDVRDMTRSGIARHMGWMTEETHLFAVSLGDNLRIARPGACDAECEAALASVGLSRWRATLHEGLATPLGDGGRPLSAGERQRLGMARALLAGGTVLLLDEPTAHLDPESSSLVLSELVGAAGDRSVLVVSHDPNVARHVDEVVTVAGPRRR